MNKQMREVVLVIRLLIEKTIKKRQSNIYRKSKNQALRKTKMYNLHKNNVALIGVKLQFGKMKIRKGVQQGCTLQPLILYYIYT